MDVKSEQLGMPFGTAQARLRKSVLFDLLVKFSLNICFRCSSEILEEKELSLEHKVPWLGKSNDLFWDLDNIGFSHLKCNSGDRRNHSNDYQKAKTHCPNGHTYSKENTLELVSPKGHIYRKCKECHNKHIWTKRGEL